MIYEPKPESRPLLRRVPPWSGGLSVGFLLAVFLLSIPTVAGFCLVAVEVAAVLDGDGPGTAAAPVP